jgi:hypothetical protein
MNFRSLFCMSQRFVSLTLVLTFILQTSSSVLIGLILLVPERVDAAAKIVEFTPSATAAIHTMTGAGTVFLDANVGYKFHVFGAAPNSGMCVYRKTTDGGLNWGNQVVVDNQTDCSGISVWYDQWTPGDTGDYIHIATYDTSADDIFYNRLDTNTDTLLLTTATTTMATVASVLSVGTNNVSITKATDGKVYVNIDDSNGTFIRSCTSSCNISTNWAAVGVAPQGNNDSWSILAPLASGNVMLINRSTTNFLRASIWNGTIWSAFTNIDTAAVRNINYDVGTAVTIDTSTNDVYVAYVTDNNDFATADHDLKTAKYTGTWSTTTASVFTNVSGRGLLQVAIAKDQTTNNIYVAYTARTNIATTSSSRVYYVMSDDEMASWGSEQGPIDTVPGDFYGLDMNIMSSDRFFVSWFDNNAVLDIFGDSIIPTPTDTMVIIDPSPNTTAAGHTMTGAGTVFIDDQIGYKFLRYGAAPDSGRCVYRKTTNGGLTWGAQVVVDSQLDCSGISVWYDRWTPGDTGNYIHVATYDIGDDDIFYNRLDTTNDSLLMVNSTTTMPASTTVLVVGTNNVAITKATDGKVYVNIDDGNGTHIRSCSSSCNIATNWSGVGVYPQGNADSWSLLMPLASGHVMLINRSTANAVRSSIWNGTNWSSFTTIDASAVRNGTYDVGMSAVVDPSTNDIYLTYVADNDSFTVADHDIRTAIYTAGSWTSKTNILTNVAGRALLQVASAMDLNNGDIYTAYTARSTIGTASTSNVYYVKSTDGMTTWGGEQGPINTVPGDFYGIDLNPTSNERLYVSWFDAITTRLDMFANTLANIGPDGELSSIGSQTNEVLADTNNFYVGGGFLLETVTAKTVSTIVVSESGTIQAQNNIKNVKLYYDLDTSSPQNCASESYVGGATQFGSTVAGGFSGADGTASFSTSPVSISSTQSMCIYVVFDIEDTAQDGDTIEISVANPETDIIVSGGTDVYPATPITIASTTTVVDPNLTQSGYHWRLDNGSETTASSATGGVENTPIPALQIGIPRRVRLAVSNQGSTSSAPSTYRLEYGASITTCEDISTWNVVGDSTADWVMSPSGNITDGEDTTNISVGSGGVTNLGVTYITNNDGLRDTLNTSGTTTLDIDNYVDFEYSIVASTSATEGSTYCFRLARSGLPLSTYTNYPEVTISADVLVESFGTQTATTSVLDTGVYTGGGFSVIENSGSRNVTSFKVKEVGTVDGAVGIENLRLYYDSDTSAPYDCSSESYIGIENQYGATSSDGFSGVGETAIFSDTVGISTTSTLCLYVVYDVTSEAANTETLDVVIESGSTDVIVSGVASVGPSGQIDITSSTTIQGANLSQTNYHWRRDNGSETTASSASSGTENTALIDFAQNSPIRLRFGVTNTGLETSVPARYRLEYSPKISTCDMATVWTDVDSTLDGWDMYNSSFVSNGETTTNIAVSTGGVSNGAGSFVGSNGGVRDTESLTATTTLPVNDYTEVEFSITSTDFTSYNTSYCFRVAPNISSFGTYERYAELTTAPKRDFKIQRGSTQVSGTSAVVTAGVGYTAPASTSLAFVIITNSNSTGAGNTSATAGQNADDVTAYISNPGNIGTSFTITRPPAATSNTRVDWEIIEFIGSAATDNEMIVRGVGTVSFTSSSIVATGTVLSNISNNSKVVVFVTGSSNRNAVRNFYASQVTSEWNTTTNSPVFRRGASGGSIADVSYAVVEFTGANWNVQRAQHAYTAAGVTETESITAVNSLARTFLHTQKRMGATTNVVHYGHQVWVSSIGAISFQLETGASVAVEQTSVAWIIENIQSGVGAMNVQRSNSSITGGTAPLAYSVILSTPITATNNTSISANTSAAGADTNFPRPIAGFTITSTSTYQIWRSNTGSALSYRVELIEWPVADLAIRQNYWRFYVDNNQLTPLDPWPLGGTDLGENSIITTAFEPLAIGERLRIRMTLKTSNATMPAGLQNFKLQYALRVTSCTAVSGGSWSDVGAAGSGVVWRGYAATGTTDGTSLSTNPPTGGDLLISVADRAGSLVHDNPSAVNPYPVDEGDNIEYDWYLEQNGANPQSTYCFRTVRSDGTPLEGYGSIYPQIRTAGFTPLTRNWRWYDDIENETPTIALAGENVAPIDIANTDTIALRISVDETKNAQGDNIKFKLQFSEDVTFSNPIDVVSTTSCQDRSLWCYTEGAGTDNQQITNQLLSDGDGCVSGIGTGCGRHNTSPTSTSAHTHFAGVTQEYSFTIRHVAARVNAVYYFRLYDVLNDIPVSLASGESYPSLVTEGPILQLSLAGLPSGTTTAGVTTGISTTPTGIDFGSLVLNTEYVAAHRITVETNATEGYQLFKFARQQLLSSNGISIPSVSGTNLIPVSWALACNASSTGCIGYHSTDPTLKNGSTRFAPSDSYAGLQTSPVEVMYSSIPAADTHDIVYRLKINELQPAGDYETEIVYLAVPSY